MKKTEKNFVIVGGVAAGPKAASHLQRLCPEANVTIIEQDSIISYGGCGIPYYICGDITDEKELRSTSFHMVRDESFFLHAKGVTVLSRHQALRIEKETKTITIRNLDNDEERTLPYDRLLLATGSTPMVPPVPGRDLDGVFTVNNMHKAVAIKERISRGQVGKAVVIGGGAIGIEMAEALTDLWGVETTLVELMEQLLPNAVDPVFSTMLIRHLEENKVTVHTAEKVLAIESDDGTTVSRVITDTRTIDADMVIMATGVRPRDELAREAGIIVAPRGGIMVNSRLRTSDPDIYAAGDCIVAPHVVSGLMVHAPFGSLANRQGRIAADNMAGLGSFFPGVCGSFIMKAFDRSIGSCGLSYKAARDAGFNAACSLTAPADRAHFYPGEAIVVMQLVFDRTSRRVLGLQAFGAMNDGVLARINAAAASITHGAGIDDLGCLEMAYAPPFAGAIDSLNAAAYVADNMAAGRLRTVSMATYYDWMRDMELHPEWVALDVRHPREATPYQEKYKEKWLAVPYSAIRDRYSELPSDKTLVILCDAGTRSYEVQTFLRSKGLDNSLVLAGGFNVIRRLGAPWLL